ncbi:MAG: lysylphosphatidylglycerol synthase transmembrane domain-containing protein, partial [Dehalococcoidia bacterium]
AYPLRWLSADIQENVRGFLEQFLAGMRALREVRLAVPAALLSMGGWLLEACSYWFFGQAFGLSLHFSEYLLIMMTANFAVSIPITPSGIGPYEVATQELIVQLGAQRALATGFAIGIHLCFIFWVTLTGLVAMWVMKLSPTEIFYLSQRHESETTAQPGAT